MNGRMKTFMIHIIIAPIFIFPWNLIKKKEKENVEHVKTYCHLPYNFVYNKKQTVAANRIFKLKNGGIERFITTIQPWNHYKWVTIRWNLLQNTHSHYILYILCRFCSQIFMFFFLLSSFHILLYLVTLKKMNGKRINKEAINKREIYKSTCFFCKHIHICVTVFVLYPSS